MITTDLHKVNPEIEKEFETLIVHHNSGWAGDVIVGWKRKPYNAWDKQDKPTQEVELPGELLKLLGYEAAKESIRSRLIECLEDV